MEKDFIKQNKISSEMIMELGRFSILWANFEWKYCETKCDETKIIQFIKDYKNIYNENDELKFFSKNFISALKKYFINKSLSINKETIKNQLYSKGYQPQQEVMDVLTKNENIIDEKTLFEGTFLICYRLRNNMFHGLKDLSEINNQLELFQKVNQLLNHVA